MSDTLIDDEEMLLKRFACDCGAIEHAMDVLLEKVPIEVIFNWYITPIGLWDKLKRIGGILMGRNVCYSEFILRKEDITELIDVLEKSNKLLELSERERNERRRK